MTTPEEKAIHAYEDDDLAGLLMGKGWYYEREAYMAPSDVPTNWDAVLEGLQNAVRRFPDLPQKLERAMSDMSTSAEGFYCALATLISYLFAQKRLAPELVLNSLKIAEVLRKQLPLIEAEARKRRPSWLGSQSESLGERIDHHVNLLKEEFGIDIRTDGAS